MIGIQERDFQRGHGNVVTLRLIGIFILRKITIFGTGNGIFQSDIVSLDISHPHLHECIFRHPLVTCPVVGSFYHIHIYLPDIIGRNFGHGRQRAACSLHKAPCTSRKLLLQDIERFLKPFPLKHVEAIGSILITLQYIRCRTFLGSFNIPVGRHIGIIATSSKIESCHQQ